MSQEIIREQDVMEKQKGCSNKHCPENLYQNDLEGEKNLCEICSLEFKKENYCIYCKQIYFETTDDGKIWIDCDECHKWVHAECADVNVNKLYGQNAHLNFKCLRCKKTDGKDGPRRGFGNRTGGGKVNKKAESGVLLNIGFQWALKPEEIDEDIEKIQSYLK